MNLLTHSVLQNMTLEIERLHAALQAAEVGTWDYNLQTGHMQWSAICKELFGLPAQMEVTADKLLTQVHPDDRERVNQANAEALSPSGNGEHDVVFRTLNPTGATRWVHARGRISKDKQGQVARFSGVVQDVTQQVLARQQIEQVEEALQQKVAERTQALSQANQDLQRSNENLQQFAYIASHDLQEPLRKIQSFGDMLKSQHGPGLGEGILYLERMQSAAIRMSTLIKDLLSYSRIATQQNATKPVDLMALVETVLSDLEVIITETNVQVTVEPLPTVVGDAGQLGQLFQNLLSNALKFYRIGIAPVVTIRSQSMTTAELPPSVQATLTAAAFHRIDVIDNGIGFDEKYIDRIFQVFQRLHSRNQFTGTGIGLAICQKVAANHGGAITANSQPGQGAIFSVYIPV